MSIYQTLCVLSQMKDTKHIRQDFHSVAWVMPQGWDFSGQGVKRSNFSNPVNFKDFYTKLFVCSHKLKIENILNRIFILLPGLCRAFDHLILGPKFGPIPNAKKYVFPQCQTKKSQIDRIFFFFFFGGGGGGSPSLFHIIQI